MPHKIGNVLSWASDVEQDTLDQAAMASRLPFVKGHLALMPDAHVGIGATIGSVIPTSGAIVPSCVGVDIGCGMVAAETSLSASDLPDSLDALMPLIEQRIPAGVGKGHNQATRQDPERARRIPETFVASTEFTDHQHKKIVSQFGSLGSGNHFAEVCLDERDVVWVVLHSGSRGIGKELAETHIARAKGLMKQFFISLENPDLAYLVEGTESFDAYISDMLWAQEYALASRTEMMRAALASLFEVVGAGHPVGEINCHHNFTQREQHHGKNLWITRKGAIRARADDLGVIPGSMGTRSYIVRGLGNEASYQSCSHGAGRRMSRGQARRTLTVASLRERMEGRAWNSDRAEALLDEHPESYKSIETVMQDQADLVAIEHTLRQVFNYKGS